MKSVLLLESLSDDELLARLDAVAARMRRVEAELIWHMAEVDRRQLFAREACSSMHVYATSRLHLSDAEAYLRIAVARVSRRFPAVFSMLADGRLHLSGIAMLGPHLREENAEALLRRAVHRSKREIELLVAEIAPRPDAPSRMRKLPRARVKMESAQVAGAAGGSGAAGAAGATGGAGGADAAARGGTSGAPVDGPALFPGGVGLQGVASEPARIRHEVATVVPTAPDRYRVQFTADEELRGKIDRARALLRHQIPDGNLAAIFDRAMTLLVRELERVRYAETAAPRKRVAETAAPSSRHIPAAIKREVWKRDGEQCTFHDSQGRRCAARERLEFHHLTPFARGGEHSAENVTLRCSLHNAYQADIDFGAEFMAARRGAPSPARCPRAVYRAGPTRLCLGNGRASCWAPGRLGSLVAAGPATGRSRGYRAGSPVDG